jgi:hypothetical protein
MLGPKNTAADVADILIAGLLNGSISLDGETAAAPQQTRDEELDELRRRKMALHAQAQRAADYLKTKR